MITTTKILKVIEEYLSEKTGKLEIDEINLSCRFNENGERTFKMLIGKDREDGATELRSYSFPEASGDDVVAAYDYACKFVSLIFKAVVDINDLAHIEIELLDEGEEEAE